MNLIIILIAVLTTFPSSEIHATIKDELEDAGRSSEEHLQDTVKNDTDYTTLPAENGATTIKEDAERPTTSRSEPKKETTTIDIPIEETTPSKEIQQKSKSSSDEAESSTVFDKISSENEKEISSTGGTSLTEETNLSESSPTIIGTIVDKVKSTYDKFHDTIVEPAFDIITFPLNHLRLQIQKTSHSTELFLKKLVDCPNETLPCDGEGYFRLNQSCTEFYECYFSNVCQKIISTPIFECPLCLKFNAKKGKCDLPENVPECTYIKNRKEKYCTATGNFSVPEDCHKYYGCNEDKEGNIQLSINTCPPSTTFSQGENACVEGDKCGVTYPICEKFRINIGDRYDCRKFYQCSITKTPIAFYCPENFIFNGLLCELRAVSKLLEWR